MTESPLQPLAKKRIEAGLGPEFTTSKEVGAELSFWGGRINIETNIYKTISEKLIFGVPVSNAAGITTKIQNIGKSSTKGVELTLNLIPVKYAKVSLVQIKRNMPKGNMKLYCPLTTES